MLKEGTTIFYGPIRKNTNLGFPARYTYQVMMAGWNERNEFVFFKK
jgi:hypothetical protein